MPMETTKSGIPIIGDFPWGSHFCHFYDSPTNLADCLVSYFKAGIDNDEGCFWIASKPFGVEDATAALRAAVPDLDRRLKRGQIEIIDVQDYYARTGQLNPEGVLASLLERKDRALSRGYSGLRASRNTCWIETREQWGNLAEYEAMVNACFRDHRILGFCSYHLDRCSAADTPEVVRNHEFALIRQSGRWEIVESASLKAAKEQLHRANEELEQRVAQRTAALRKSKERLAAESTALQRLQEISTLLDQEDDVDALYSRLLDVAVELMRSDMASMQMLNDNRSEPTLLAWRGFHPESAKFWEYVQVGEGSSCAAAMSSGQRVVVPNVEACGFMAGTADLDFYRLSKIRAVQSTPLISRFGRLLGMISTHWRQPHQPGEHELQLFDILARQAADLVERRLAFPTLREEARTLETLNCSSAPLASELDLNCLVQAVTDAGVELSGAEFGAFFYNALNELGESYMLYTLSGAPREAFANFPTPRNKTLFGPTFRGESIVRSDDILKDPRYGRNPPYQGMPQGHLPVRSYLAVPVISRSGEVLAACSSATRSPAHSPSARSA